MRGYQGSVFRSFPVNRLRQEMDRVVSEVFVPMAGEFNSWLGSSTGAPRLNVWEEGDVLFAEAEVPGLRQEELDVSVVGKQLTIKGHRTTTTDGDPQQKQTVYHRRERSMGEFVRSITLPAEIDADQVSASLVGGVLTIRLPKAEAAKPRKIDIRS